jgi:hypothetical protein
MYFPSHTECCLTATLTRTKDTFRGMKCSLTSHVGMRWSLPSRETVHDPAHSCRQLVPPGGWERSGARNNKRQLSGESVGTHTAWTEEWKPSWEPLSIPSHTECCLTATLTRTKDTFRGMKCSLTSHVGMRWSVPSHPTLTHANDLILQ